MINLVLRLDDPSETSHQGVEAGILDALQLHRACASFAVIPFRMVDGQRIPLTMSRSRPLIEATREGVIDVALHGHTHIKLHPDSSAPTEFCGRSLDQQHSLISEGRSHLESVFGCRIQGFVPPWNSYDSATLNVLEQDNFSYMSAGWKYYRDYCGPMQLLPFTAKLQELPNALREARRFSKLNPTVVVIMHLYDFVEVGSDLAVIDVKGFSDLLGQLAKQPDIKLVRLGDLVEDHRSANRQMRQNWLLKKYKLPSSLLPQYCFLDAPLWRGMLAGMLGR